MELEIRGKSETASFGYPALSPEVVLKSQNVLPLMAMTGSVALLGSVSLSVMHIPIRDHGASLV